jgi:hypothetical protein
MAGYIGSKAVNLSTTGADINGDANIDGDLSFRDNDKAIFGAGSDLQIYHDGSNSFISDQGTGNLKILADDFRIRNAADTASYIFINSGAEVGLTYNGATKLATTATGVDITGVLTSNKVQIDNGLADGGELLLASQGYNSWQLDNSAGSVRFIYDGKVPYQINGPSDAFIWRSSTSANTERMRIDASGNLLVGTTLSPTSLSSTSSEEGMAIGGDGLVVIANDGQSPLVLNRLSSDGNILNFNKNGSTVGNIGTYAGDLTIGDDDIGIRFDTGSGLVPWDLGANSTGGSARDAAIDIGAASARWKDLYLSGNIAASNSSSLQFGSTSCAIEGTSSGADYIKITTNSSEAMRIDSSGNLLVGQTVASNSVNGTYIRTGDRSGFNHTNGACVSFNRLSSDGDIVEFRKNGTSVGSISCHGADFGVGAGDTGLRWQPSSDSIFPYNTVGDSGRDNAIDLGKSDNRFDDIYATNGTIQTSDRNEKQDIAELSDAEQRVAVAAKGLLRKFRWRDAVAEKGDEARTHFGIIAQDLQAAFAAEGLDAGDYAMFISSTWTDEETGEERTRMGVRYSELLAFIIGAL